MINNLKALMFTPSISGRESAVCEKIREMIAPFVDEVNTDNLGNLIALKKGSEKDAKKIMLCAHMDEIGFLVTFIEENGWLRISSVGGISFTASAFSEVISDSGVAGVLVPNSGTEPDKFSADKFYIDIGAKNKKEAEKKVKIGDFFICRPSLTRLMGTRLCGRPFDDKVGCAILIDIAEKLASKDIKNDVYYVFSVQEEVGCRGAKTAAFAIAPDYALVFDVTGTGDTPSAKPMACKLGGGAAIKIKDASVICHKDVVEKLIDLAKENKIAYQCEILTYGGTDTSSIQMSGVGAMAGALSIPSRYIHSGVEMIDTKDTKACVELASKFIESI